NLNRFFSLSNLLLEMNYSSNLSLTLDTWTAINQAAFLGVIIIIRDNASSNTTLIAAFIREYTMNSLKFIGDIACITHVLNLAVQDILKNLIKDNDYDQNDDIWAVENEEEKDASIRKIIISLKYSQENRRLLKAQITYGFLNLDPVFSHAISLGVAKLRKYYPKYSIINDSNKAIYLALILDPRIKKAGLEGIRFTSRVLSDIETLLKADYTKYKDDYLQNLPSLPETRYRRVYDNDDNLDIYLDLVEDFDIDKITLYFEERRARKENLLLD
ncbi:hypothetical protein LOCC1_G008433, partial [Lachnellula occidentalis]